MGGFAFQVACLRLVANEPLFGVYAVPVDFFFFLFKMPTTKAVNY